MGPEAHAAIVSVTGPVDVEVVRTRLQPVHELAHVTVEVRCHGDVWIEDLIDLVEQHPVRIEADVAELFEPRDWTMLSHRVV